MWDIKGALTWPGVDHGAGTDGASNSHCDDNNSNESAIHNDNNNGEDGTGIAIMTNSNTTLATAITPSYIESAWSAEDEEEEDRTDCRSTAYSTQQIEAPSAAPLGCAVGPHDDDTSTLSPQQKRSSPAPGRKENVERAGSSVAVGGSNNSDDFSAGDGPGSRTAKSTASNKGYSTLWPSEPSKSIGDEEYGDRYRTLCICTHITAAAPITEGS